jgi:hypothetical protein
VEFWVQKGFDPPTQCHSDVCGQVLLYVFMLDEAFIETKRNSSRRAGIECGYRELLHAGAAVGIDML